MKETQKKALSMIGRTTDRLSIGYDGKDIVMAVKASSNAERAELQWKIRM